LDRAGIQHALCGGIAANLYRTEMRATNDVDLYIACTSPELVSLTRLFEREGWRAHPAWRKAELLRLERDERPRVDLLIASTDFERRAVERAVPYSIGGDEIRVLLPEDLIVFKLVAGRARDYEAVAAIVNVSLADLDTSFIQRSLDEFGMADRWLRALEEAEREAEDRG
jgi:predicted nucleotidyltransferase